MKNRVYQNPDGTISVVIPAPKARNAGETDQQFLDRVYADLQKNDPSIPSSFVDIDPSSMPARTDADGVSVRSQWRLVGSSVVKDNTVRNPHRELFDKDAEIAAIKSKGNSMNVNDLLDIHKKQVERDNIVKDIKGR